MNYIMIRTDDMLNGDGLRVVLFCTSCNHYCNNCHNPETWDASNGFLFDDAAKENVFKELENDYISGLTLSGGDPLNKNNLHDILDLCKEVKERYPDKSIWIYSGFTWQYIITKFNEYQHTPFAHDAEEHLLRHEILQHCDIFVDDVFIEDLVDVNYHWAGSTNQKIINIKESLKQNKLILYCD